MKSNKVFISTFSSQTCVGKLSPTPPIVPSRCGRDGSSLARPVGNVINPIARASHSSKGGIKLDLNPHGALPSSGESKIHHASHRGPYNSKSPSSQKADQPSKNGDSLQSDDANSSGNSVGNSDSQEGEVHGNYDDDANLTPTPQPTFENKADSDEYQYSPKNPTQAPTRKADAVGGKLNGNNVNDSTNATTAGATDDVEVKDKDQLNYDDDLDVHNTTNKEGVASKEANGFGTNGAPTNAKWWTVAIGAAFFAFGGCAAIAKYVVSSFCSVLSFRSPFMSNIQK